MGLTALPCGEPIRGAMQIIHSRAQEVPRRPNSEKKPGTVKVPPRAAWSRPCGNKCRPQVLFGAALSVTLPPTGMTAASWSIDLLPGCGVPPPGPAPAQLMAVLQWFDVQLSESQGQIWTTFNGTNHFFLSLILLWLLQTPGGVDSSGNTATMRRTGAEKVKGCELSFEIDAGTDAK
ncbi:hypothetical protein C8R47DRAFT_1080727 [Mycena vitilis]|nr:hypothetical protein C8R47DRAFT_1080727 [Mycena vitilis]